MLCAGDSAPKAYSLDVETSQASDVARVLIVVRTPRGRVMKWDLTPTAVVPGVKVTVVREFEVGDLPEAAPEGYWMRAWVYAAGDVKLFVTDPFRGPIVSEQRVPPPG